MDIKKTSASSGEVGEHGGVLEHLMGLGQEELYFKAKIHDKVFAQIKSVDLFFQILGRWKSYTLTPKKRPKRPSFN